MLTFRNASFSRIIINGNSLVIRPYMLSLMPNECPA